MTIVKVTSKPDASGTWRYLHCDACGGSATEIWIVAGKSTCFACLDARKKEQGK